MGDRSVSNARIMRFKPVPWTLILLFSSLLCVACAPVSPPESRPAAQDHNFTLFLQPLPQETSPISFQIGEALALKADGSTVPLDLLARDFERVARRKKGQRMLVHDRLPPGDYQGIVLRITSASLKGEEGDMALLPPGEPLHLDCRFVIGKNRITTLLLSVSSERLVTDGAFFTPRITLRHPPRLLNDLKGFVSNEGTNDLTVFNKRNNQVNGMVRIGSGPSDLALDEQRSWLYVALAGENAIAVLDVNSEEVLGRVSLRLGDHPEELALGPGGETLLALNRDSASVSIMDTDALFETGRVRLQEEGDGLFFGNQDNRAYVAHSMSSSLSVIDLKRAEVRHIIPLREAPLDGVAAKDGQRLHLINRFSGDLTVLDASFSGGEKQIFIGSGATTILSDQKSGLLYIGRKNGKIAVVDPRARLSLDSFQLNSGTIRDLTIDNDQNALFVLVPESKRLYKVDLISKRVLGETIVTDGASSVVLMGER